MTYTDLRTFREWRRDGRGILKGEKHVARSRKGCLFDVSQTGPLSSSAYLSPEDDRAMDSIFCYDYELNFYF